MRDWMAHNRDKVRYWSKRYYAQNPRQYPVPRAEKRAQHIVEYEIRTGRLIPQPCEVCGEKAEAHHDDYSKPLDVRWLCRIHHCALHVAQRDAARVN